MILNHVGSPHIFVKLDPRVLGDSRLSRAMLVVYQALMAHSSGWNLTRSGIEQMTNLNRRTVGRALSDLESLGYIQRKAVDGRDGQWGSTICTVLRVPPIPDSESDLSHEYSGSGSEAGGLYAPGVGVCAPPGWGSVDPPIIDKYKERDIDITPYSPPEGDGDDSTGEVVPMKKKPGRNDYSQEFENFWAVYPRSVDKGRAFKAWERVLKATTLDHVMTQAAAYAELCRLRKTETRFIRHPTTFINNVEDADYYSELMDERQSANNGYSQSSNPFDDIRSNRAANAGIVDGEVTSTQWI